VNEILQNLFLAAAVTFVVVSVVRLGQAILEIEKKLGRIVGLLSEIKDQGERGR
jgi:hypothetical protein